MLTVTTFCEYWGAILRLQSGVLQLTVMMEVPAVFAVTVPELVVVLVPRLTEAAPAGTEVQVTAARMATPAESITSATRAWVAVGARLNVVLVLLASCTLMDTTGQTSAGCGVLLSPAAEADMVVEPGSFAVRMPVVVLLAMTVKSVLK